MYEMVLNMSGFKYSGALNIPEMSISQGSESSGLYGTDIFS